jgi:hypothetical protein
MRAVAAVLIALLIGVGLGVASAYVAVERFAMAGEVRVGQWRGNLNTGSTAADPYTRAAIAKVGLLALARTETIYFFRDSDEEGAPINPACTYLLVGSDQPARWWSVTLYDEQYYLARNDDDATSVDATRTVRNPGGDYSVRIGPARGDAQNWLSTNGAKAVNLTIRLYNPNAEVQGNPASLRLPLVQKVSCPTGSAP